MLIRVAVAADAEGIMATHVSAIHQTCSVAYEPDEISAWTSGLTPQRYLQPIAEHFFFVAVLDQKVVGFGHLDEGSAEVCGMFVNPAHAGQGIGRRLLQTIEASAARHRLARLHLQSTLNAIGFYQAHGFVLDGMSSFHGRSGVSLPCAAMHKDLGAEPTNDVSPTR